MIFFEKGDTVHFYLKAYLVHSAFTTPDPILLNPSSIKQLDEELDPKRVSQQDSLNQLFTSLSLLPQTDTTSASTTTTTSTQSIQQVYRQAASHDLSIPRSSPSKSFKLQLRPYQEQALTWLTKMEGPFHQDAREDVSIHPLWQELSALMITLFFFYTSPRLLCSSWTSYINKTRLFLILTSSFRISTSSFSSARVYV